MEDPDEEIVEVVHLLTTASTPEVQQAAVRKFFISNAAFNHTLCRVNAAEDSRDHILGIYQWYRILSPHLDLKVEHHVFDADQNTIYLSVTQTFHLWFSPLKAIPSHLVVRITLLKEDGKYFITKQEDFYQPEDIAHLVLPPLAVLVNLAKIGASIVSNLGAWFHQTLFGWWKPNFGPLHRD